MFIIVTISAVLIACQVSDAVLQLALRHAEHTDRGLTLRGLRQTYERDSGAVLLQEPSRSQRQ